MSDLAALVDNLYTRFILRDVFGKVVPGAILLLVVAMLATGENLAEITGRASDVHGAIIAMGAGLSWLLGFVAQAPFYFLWDRKRWQGDKRLRDLLCRQRFDSKVRQLLERQAVIKEATGNMSISLSAVAVSEGIQACVESNGARVWVALAALIGTGVLGAWHRHALNNERCLQRLACAEGDGVLGRKRYSEESDEKGAS